MLTAPRPVLVACLVAAILAGACSATPQQGAPPAATSSPGKPAGTSQPPTTSSPASDNPGHLTDAQMVGQLFMSYAYGSGADQVTAAQRSANLSLYGAPTPAAVVRRWHLGGIILIDHNTLDAQRPELSTGNVEGAAQITRLTTGLQHAAQSQGDPPLLIATDQEGGLVQRIHDGVDPRPSQRALAQLGTRALTCSYYRLGQQLRSLGVNQDFAPVADVTRTSTGIIGDRSFGPDPDLDGRDVSDAVTGLQDAGVLATLKHWPGHGSTTTDSHLSLAVIHESAAIWRRVDRVPFARAAPKAAAIMVGHLALPALDPTGRPATFSSTLTRRLLRESLGYRGLIVSDSLWMAPARHQGPPGPSTLAALDAGNDLLLEPPSLPKSYTAVLRAVRTHPSVRRLVRSAARHVLETKRRAQQGPRPTAACTPPSPQAQRRPD